MDNIQHSLFSELFLQFMHVTTRGPSRNGEKMVRGVGGAANLASDAKTNSQIKCFYNSLQIILVRKPEWTMP